MFDKEDFIQHILNLLKRTEEFRMMEERHELWRTIVEEYQNAYYNSKIPQARENFENKVAEVSIRFLIKYLNSLMK